MCSSDLIVPYSLRFKKLTKYLFMTESIGFFAKCGRYIQKTKIIASGPITSWEIDGETVEKVLTLFFWAPKSLQMVIAAMKLKDAYSLEGKL